MTPKTREAADVDALLRKTCRMSLLLLSVSGAYGIIAMTVVTAVEMTKLGLLVVTASAVMNAWVNRRVIVEMPKYRSLLHDHGLIKSHGVVRRMIVIDAISLIASVAAAAWLILKLVGHSA